MPWSDGSIGDEEEGQVEVREAAEAVQSTEGKVKEVAASDSSQTPTPASVTDDQKIEKEEVKENAS